MLSAIMEAAGAREGVLFLFNDKPAMLTSASAQGFALLPDPAFIPLLPKHVHALTAARGPIVLNASTYSVFLSSNGNVAPELFKCLAPLKAGGTTGGSGRSRPPPRRLPCMRTANSTPLDLLCSYVALAVQNHALTQTIAQRVTENLRLMASLHGFYDNALEAFATAIDVKHVNIHGHSLRVGRYAAAIGEAMGMEPARSQRCAAPDICTTSEKLPSTAACSARPRALDAEEIREMADHTVVGHQIVSSVQFPWPKIPETVRWHHERSDGSGYPDALAGRRLAHGGAHHGPGRYFRRHDQRAPLPRSAVGRAARSAIWCAWRRRNMIPTWCRRLLIQVRREAVGQQSHPAAATTCR